LGRIYQMGESVNKDKTLFFVFQAADYEGLICTFVEMLASQYSQFVKNDTLNIIQKKLNALFSYWLIWFIAISVHHLK